MLLYIADLYVCSLSVRWLYFFKISIVILVLVQVPSVHINMEISWKHYTGRCSVTCRAREVLKKYDVKGDGLYKIPVLHNIKQFSYK